MEIKEKMGKDANIQYRESKNEDGTLRKKKMGKLEEVRKKRREDTPEEKPPSPDKFGGLWMDVRLGKNIMNTLWDNINTSKRTEEENANSKLAGNISESWFIKDKDNWLMENVLKECCDYMFFKESWTNYYNVRVSKAVDPPVYVLDEYWVNYQKQTEFNPPHMHSGMWSFVIFMKIPTHYKEQHALPISANSNAPCVSDFQFWPPNMNTTSRTEANYALSAKDEGRMLFFPAWLVHQVFPFYGTEEERVTVSGNILIKNNAPLSFEIEMDEKESDSQNIHW